ncbi:MAG: radical SAM protein, partial [Anaerolineaceae bacterium]|nr:radical SAM protein [Anaerolineaceae bacterium]
MECAQAEGSPGFFERLRVKTASEGKPLAGSLEATFRCNLRCGHCYVGDYRNGLPGKQELSLAEIQRMLDEAAQAGCFWFLMTGGEPLMRRDWLEIYRYAKQKGLIVTLFTNGTMLTGAIADALAELPPYKIEITLYGATQETYERVTGVSGSFGRCMQGIELLLARGLPLQLKTMVMKANRREVEAMKGFAESRGVGFRYDPLLVGGLDGNQELFAQRLSP